MGQGPNLNTRYQELSLLWVCHRNLPVQNDINGSIKVRNVGQGSKGLMGAADLLRSADLRSNMRAFIVCLLSFTIIASHIVLHGCCQSRMLREVVS